MREKARIKPFCDELAALWESKAPGMRFGQIVVRAVKKPVFLIGCILLPKLGQNQ